MGVKRSYESNGDTNMSSPYDTVERLIDKYGVADTLLMISDICHAKEDHIMSSYGNGLSEKWNKAARVVARAVKDLPKVSGIK
jgi:hypothetical protein